MLLSFLKRLTVHGLLTLTDHGKVNWVRRLYLSASNVLTTQSLGCYMFAAVTRVAPLQQSSETQRFIQSTCS